MPVMMSSQTISGQIHLNVYTPLRLIQDAGVVGHLSMMTPETAFIKLAYLLSCDKSNIKTKLMENLCGEHNTEEPFGDQESFNNE